MKSPPLLGLFLLWSVARPCPDQVRCRRCAPDGSRRCLVCDSGFVDPATRNCSFDLSPPIDDCVVYARSTPGLTVCTECAAGFVLDPAGLGCLPCKTKYCAICDLQGKCSACFDRRTVDPGSGRCEFRTVCRKENCRICSSGADPEICHLCDNGFSLGAEPEPECVAAPPNCLHINPAKNAGMCLGCQVGFYLTERGTCLSSRYASGFTGLLLGVCLVFFGLLHFIFTKQLGEEGHVAEVKAD